MFNLARSWQQHCPLPCAPLIRRPPQPTLKIVRGHARRQMNIAAGAEKRLGDLGALVRAFHVEDEKGGSLAAFEAEICRLRLEFLDEGRDRLLQRSRFQRVAPVGREFPPFSSTSSSVPCNISVGKAAEGRSGKRATSNSGGCNQKYRTPPNASSTARSATALNSLRVLQLKTRPMV